MIVYDFTAAIATLCRADIAALLMPPAAPMRVMMIFSSLRHIDYAAAYVLPPRYCAAFSADGADAMLFTITPPARRYSLITPCAAAVTLLLR